MDISKIKVAISALVGVAVSWIGHMWEVTALVFMAILIDYITGLLAGRSNEGLNSKRAAKGMYKKVGIIALLCFGCFLDDAFNYYISKGFNFEMAFELPIGVIISIWIIITESISICENLEKLGVPIPQWLMKLLRKTKNNVDN